ncbi:MAG: S8 family serine peptidase [Oligoflexia bacterium]|nr:S8 family serine peptidase [Oligoflexia bacterium]
MRIQKQKFFFILRFVLLTLTLALFSNNSLFLTKAYGSTISVIDSGVDVNTNIIRNHLWINKLEIPNNFVDDDHNGHIDDIFGWNFVDDNNILLVPNYPVDFTSEHKLFLEIEAKIAYATATPNEIFWIKKKLADKKFMKEITFLGTYIHGTHVSGIIVNESNENRVQIIKIVSTPKPPVDNYNINVRIEDLPIPIVIQKDIKDAIAEGLTNENLVKFVLARLVIRELAVVQKIIKYIDTTGVQVANASFGTGIVQGEKIVTTFFRMVLKRFPTKKELLSVRNHFLYQVLANSTTLYGSANNTLFVFAAGNDGSNNDEYYMAPANIRLENTISVGAWRGPVPATRNSGELASFSNYGNKTVDVAAPGVGIVSVIPGNKSATLSGTSQAAPYVSNIAGEILNINSRLSPANVKEIIIKTVDYKATLKGKIASSGVVNKSRALLAAKYSNGYSLSQAIDKAKKEIKSFSSADTQMRPITPSNTSRIYKELEYVIPLPSEFDNFIRSNHE